MTAVSPAKSARPPAPSATAGIMTSRAEGAPAPLSTPNNEPSRCTRERSAPSMKPATTSLPVPATSDQQPARPATRPGARAGPREQSYPNFLRSEPQPLEHHHEPEVDARVAAMLLASLEPRCCAKLFERGVTQPQLGSTSDTIDPVTTMQVGRRNRPRSTRPPRLSIPLLPLPHRSALFTTARRQLV